jgi:hypothetical protein
MKALKWLAEGRYQGDLRVAVTAATGRDPRAEILEPDETPEEAMRRDAEALKAFATMAAQMR